MTERSWQIFFEVYEPLPRQGPGNRASAQKALALCSDLPACPAVLDLGCGSGGQTLHLAELTNGRITAMDSHAPSIERLQSALEQRGLTERVRTVVGDMSAPTFDKESFDLIWSEGALYNIGIGKALALYHDVAKAGGYFAFTDAVWLTEDAPDDVKASFAEYPGMGFVDDVLSTIEKSPWAFVDHFILPEEAWWGDFYTPMERRIEELRGKYAKDDEALTILDELGKEPAIYREHASTFGYEFFVLRRAP